MFTLVPPSDAPSARNTPLLELELSRSSSEASIARALAPSSRPCATFSETLTLSFDRGGGGGGGLFAGFVLYFKCTRRLLTLR